MQFLKTKSKFIDNWVWYRSARDNSARILLHKIANEVLVRIRVRFRFTLTLTLSQLLSSVRVLLHQTLNNF